MNESYRDGPGCSPLEIFPRRAAGWSAVAADGAPSQTGGTPAAVGAADRGRPGYGLSGRECTESERDRPSGISGTSPWWTRKNNKHSRYIERKKQFEHWKETGMDKKTQRDLHNDLHCPWRFFRLCSPCTSYATSRPATTRVFGGRHPSNDICICTVRLTFCRSSHSFRANK